MKKWTPITDWELISKEAHFKEKDASLRMKKEQLKIKNEQLMHAFKRLESIDKNDEDE